MLSGNNEAHLKNIKKNDIIYIRLRERGNADAEEV
jgi:hypothetical protein